MARLYSEAAKERRQDMEALSATLWTYRNYALKTLALGDTYVILERDHGRSEDDVLKMTLVGFGPRFATFQTAGGYKRCYNYFDIFSNSVRIGRLKKSGWQERIDWYGEES